MDDWTPDIETAIALLESLGSDQDPVAIPIRNTNGRIIQWLELRGGINDLQGGGLMHVPAKRCEMCYSEQCEAVIDCRGSAHEFKLKYHSHTDGYVLGTLFEMVLDRMGVGLIK